jgi:KDO2-lipid IV(A) lauroyltransferase
MFSYFIHALLWVFSYFPFRVLYVCADVACFFTYRVFRYRRGEVRENLRRALPDKSPGEIKRIEKKFYRHLADIAVELYKLWHAPEHVLARRCVFKGLEIPRKFIAEGRSLVVVAGHHGNWEWLSLFGLHAEGTPYLALHKPLHDRVMERLSRRVRSRFGTVLVTRNDLSRAILKHRADGRPFIVTFIADQTPKESTLNFWTTFLGRETPVFRGAEKIAAKYDMPVLFLGMRKVRRGHYEAIFHLVHEHPATLPVGELTRMHTRFLEEEIREQPEYWLWSHRRWKYARPDGTPLY